MIRKLLVIKIKESEKEAAQEVEKPLDIIGSVKTVGHYLSNSGNNNLSPNEKESLRQRTNQPLYIAVKTEQNKEEQVNEPKRKRLVM